MITSVIHIWKPIGLLILMICLVCCRDNNKKPESKTEIVIYDTIVMDYDIENEKQELKNSSYEKLSILEIIDTLKSISEIQGIMELNENGLPFGKVENISKYYTNNIPSPIYKKIFSDEIIQIDKIRTTNAKVDDIEKKVIIQKGAKRTEIRAFKNLLSVIEKDNYLQLVLTKQGKYAPEVELVTISNKDFSQIDNLCLFGGIYDSYDINYWHSKFSKGYEGILLTKVENTKFDEIKLDTTIINYRITKNGEILKK